MTIKSTILSIFACMFLVFACKKEDIKKESPKTRTDLLTAGKWMTIAHTGITTINGRESIDEYYEKTDSCKKDNTYWYDKSGKLCFDEGVKKCSEFDPQSGTVATWTLTNNDSIIVLKNGIGRSYNHEIIELTDNLLKTQFISIADSIHYRDIITYKRVN